MSSISVSGKIFLCGEYSVLFGGPAILCLTEKRFALKDTDLSKGFFLSLAEIHPESPAGRLFRTLSDEQKIKLNSFYFEDPFCGRGGFGASTAQFALLWDHINGVHTKKNTDESWKSIYHDYLDLFMEAPKPSGADLVAQVNGGGCIYFNPTRQEVKTIDLPSYFKNTYIFSAAHKENRKIKTHEHINDIEKIPNESLSILSETTEEIFFSIQDLGAYINGIKKYVEELKNLNLVHPGALEDMNLLNKVPGVLYSKGCGALLSDAIIVYSADECQEDILFQKAKECDLEFIQKGISFQKGLSG